MCDRPNQPKTFSFSATGSKSAKHINVGEVLESRSQNKVQTFLFILEFDDEKHQHSTDTLKHTVNNSGNKKPVPGEPQQSIDDDSD